MSEQPSEVHKGRARYLLHDVIFGSVSFSETTSMFYRQRESVFIVVCQMVGVRHRIAPTELGINKIFTTHELSGTVQRSIRSFVCVKKIYRYGEPYMISTF